MASGIEIDGLKEFASAVRKIDKEAAKGLKKALDECSTFLISKTQPKIPKRTGRAARSLKKRSDRSRVRISVGGRAAPHYPWLDFGGRTGRRRSVQREFIKKGRYLYPTLGEHQVEFNKIMQRNLAGVAESVGLEVR